MPAAARKRHVGTVLLLAVLAAVAVSAVVYFAVSPTGLPVRQPSLKAPAPSTSLVTTLAPADHFVGILPLSMPSLSAAVTVRDQFGERALDVFQLVRLWTPAAKVPRLLSASEVLKASYPSLHYLCYGVKAAGGGGGGGGGGSGGGPAADASDLGVISGGATVGDASGAKVKATDQFGVWELTLGSQELLCAPASKKVTSGSGHDPNAPLGDPTLKEHLDCFPVGPVPLGKDVTVRDQFGQRALKLIELRRLCAPSVKAHGQESPSGSFSEKHYLCYRVQPVPLAFGVAVQDQFGQYPLNLKEIQELCTPAKKERLQAPPPARGCGDGIVDPAAGEQCEPPGGIAAPDSLCPGAPCDANCQCPQR